LLRIGKILHLSNSQHLIAKMEGASPPPLGSKIFDDRLKAIGSVNDVLGPTSAPYLSIRPFMKSPSNLVGMTVYMPNMGRR